MWCRSSVSTTRAACSTARCFVGLLDLHHLKAPGQRRVLLEVFLVLGPGGRRDRSQLAARERRLEQIGRISLPRASTGADQGVRLVDEENDRLGRRLDLVDDGLQTVFELTLDAGPGLQQTQIERADRDTSAARAERHRRRCAGRILRRRRSCPTPASPVRIGLFCRRRIRMSTIWRSSASRPSTGSMRPSRARCGQIDGELVERGRRGGPERTRRPPAPRPAAPAPSRLIGLGQHVRQLTVARHLAAPWRTQRDAPDANRASDSSLDQRAQDMAGSRASTRRSRSSQSARPRGSTRRCRDSAPAPWSCPCGSRRWRASGRAASRDWSTPH